MLALRPSRLLLALVLVALLLRLAVAFSPLPLPRSNDDLAYQRIGLSLARGEGFRDPQFAAIGEPYLDRPPLTPLILAGLYRTFGIGDPNPVQALLFSLLGALTVPASFWLAAPLFGRRAALLAALLVATYPMLVLLSAYTLTESIAAPLTALGALGLLKVARGATARWLLFTGLCLGIGILNRSDGLVLLVGGLLFVFLAGSGPARSRLLKVTAVGLVAALVVSPWTLRNYLESGQAVLVDTVFFPAFYLGNNPDTRQALLWELETGREGSVLGEGAEEPLRGLTGAARRAREWELAWGYILTHPIETAQTTAFKLLLFWRAYSHPLDVAATLAVEALALPGLWHQRRRWRLWLPLLLLVLLYALAHSIASALPRNRLTMMPVVLLFSGAGLQFLLSGLEGLRNRILPRVGSPRQGV